jgi:hypothetical protein
VIDTVRKQFRLRCPYCGYERNSDVVDIYCGPHKASVGPNTYTAVRMVEVKIGEQAHIQ